MGLRKLIIRIGAKDSASKVFKSVKGAATATFRAIKVGAVAAGVALAGLVVVGKKMFDQYQLAAQANAKVNAILKATGFAAGFTSGEIDKQAKSLEMLTGTNKNVIKSAQGILLTFKNIKGDQFKEATLASLDMAAALKKSGQDTETVEQNMIQVGKALNDPIKGYTALNRVGITFSKQQEQQIRTLQGSGDVMGAQAVILKELQSEFAGTAKAVNDTDHGLARMSNSWQLMKEKVGQAIGESEAFDGVINKITLALESLAESGQIELWAENVRQAISDTMPFIDSLIDGFNKVKDSVDALEFGTKSVGSFQARFEAQKEGGTFNPIDNIRALIRTIKGGGIQAAMSDALDQQITADMTKKNSTAARLASIKARNAERAAALEAKDRAAMGAVDDVLIPQALSLKTETLGIGDLFTMMQTGSATGNPMLDEAKKTNELLTTVVEIFREDVE
jgi:hypothetical protein